MVLVAIMVGVIAIISFIYYVRGNGSNINGSAIECISEKSKLYVSSTCGHCAQQKNLLGDNLEKFEVIDCSIDREECIEENVRAVPTWIINGEKYTGVKSIPKLKDLAGCENV